MCLGTGESHVTIHGAMTCTRCEGTGWIWPERPVQPGDCCGNHLFVKFGKPAAEDEPKAQKCPGGCGSR